LRTAATAASTRPAAGALCCAAPVFGAAGCARLRTGPALGPASPRSFRSRDPRPLRLEPL